MHSAVGVREARVTNTVIPSPPDQASCWCSSRSCLKREITSLGTGWALRVSTLAWTRPSCIWRDRVGMDGREPCGPGRPPTGV